MLVVTSLMQRVKAEHADWMGKARRAMRLPPAVKSLSRSMPSSFSFAVMW